MDPFAFRDDIDRVPAQFADLADRVDTGLEGLDAAVLRAWGRSRILILGIGSSRYASDVVALRLRAAGADVVSESASAVVLPPATPDLAVIAVSATGRSAEVLAAIDRYRGAVPVIAVTNDPASVLAARADAVVPLHAGIEKSGIACRTFRATFAVLEALLSALTGIPSETFGARALRRAGEATSVLLDSSGEWVGPLSDLLGGPHGAWTLAPLERLSSAQQAALMMREVPRRPAQASETGEWSHVDVYLTKTLDYRAVLFTGSPWDDQALEWMRSRGSRFAAVGESVPDAEVVIGFPGADDAAVCTLTEPLVGELVADAWLRAAAA